MNIADIDVDSILDLKEIPQTVKGGFQRRVEVYRVADDGTTSKVGFSKQCTFSGDDPSEVIDVPQDGQVLIIWWKTYGNRGSVWARLYR